MILTGVRRIDPRSGEDVVGDFEIRLRPGLASSAWAEPQTRAAAGQVLVPGFIDLHAHLREPGFEESETVETGAHADRKSVV